MAATKRDRQKAMREARRARELALAKARARRRRAIQIGVGVVAALAVMFLLSRGGDDSTDVATTDTSTTISPSPLDTVAAATGKPCVAVADPLPAGAPAVPVKLGPPPAQLIKEDLKIGTGATVGPKDTVTAHYIGVSCSTGKIFDSSYSRGQPTPFSLSGVIKGWTDGIPGMQVGGQRLLGIPPAQAYDAQGSPPDIAPGETLWFVVEIVDTKAG
jgi:peptidylprolyl isomerase